MSLAKSDSDTIEGWRNAGTGEESELNELMGPMEPGVDNTQQTIFNFGDQDKSSPLLSSNPFHFAPSIPRSMPMSNFEREDTHPIQQTTSKYEREDTDPTQQTTSKYECEGTDPTQQSTSAYERDEEAYAREDVPFFSMCSSDDEDYALTPKKSERAQLMQERRARRISERRQKQEVPIVFTPISGLQFLDEAIQVDGVVYTPPAHQLPSRATSRPIPIPPRSPHSRRPRTPNRRPRGPRTSKPPSESFRHFPPGFTYVEDDIMFCMTV